VDEQPGRDSDPEKSFDPSLIMWWAIGLGIPVGLILQQINSIHIWPAIVATFLGGAMGFVHAVWVRRKNKGNEQS